MKGIVLAGGTGSRLWPITKVTSKQLLPIYDKPMIYYPLATLMLAGVRDILIITTPHDQSAFETLLGDGSQFGIKLTYAVQPKPEGLAQAFIIGEAFLAGESCLMILGDNIFHGAGLGHQLQETIPSSGAHIFTYAVSDPTQYGVLNIDSSGHPIAIEEKPKNPSSNLAVTGLYYFDSRVVNVAKQVKASSRGELEITSVIEWYLQKNQLTLTQLTRGAAWLDTGNPKSMHDAASYVRLIEERTGLKIACLEEIGLNRGWLSESQALNSNQNSRDYQDYIASIINNKGF
jgi:glucose-1-phosphate thymidylyltransferase